MGATVHSVVTNYLRARASETPQARAYTYLRDGESSEEVSTWAGLDLRARAIAGELQCRGFSGQPVILLCPTGLEFIAALLGCFYAGAVAVPASCPRR
jgi:acyl-CoA synthetase (AMP-forming)/AMP-acid ligase II